MSSTRATRPSAIKPLDRVQWNGRRTRPLLTHCFSGIGYPLECSLLYHGEFGVEAQLLLEVLHIGRTFVVEGAGGGWAENERTARTADS